MKTLPINYVMSFTQHAEQRVNERFVNLTVEELLCDEVTDVNTATYDYYLDNCEERSKTLLLSGTRELVVFKSFNIIAVVDIATLTVITVLPTTSKKVMPKMQTKEQMIKSLKVKVKKTEELPESYRKRNNIGQELHRIYMLLKDSKGEAKSKVDKLLHHISKIESENKAMKLFVKNKFGDIALNELYKEIEKVRVQQKELK